MLAWDPCDKCKNRIREAVCLERLPPPNMPVVNIGRGGIEMGLIGLMLA